MKAMSELRNGDVIYVRAPVSVERHGYVEGEVYRGTVIETPAENGCWVPAFRIDDKQDYCILHHPLGESGLDDQDWIDATEEEYLAQQESSDAQDQANQA